MMKVSINDLKKIKEAIFEDAIAKTYWGSVGHLIVHEIRQTEDIFEAFKKLKKYKETTPQAIKN